MITNRWARAGALLLLAGWAAACGSGMAAAPVVEIAAAEGSGAPVAGPEEGHTKRDAKAPKARPARPAVEAPVGDVAAAEAAFEAGRELMRQGKVPEACAKFDESLRLDRALGTLLNLAMCEEKKGDVGAACAHYGEGFAMAQQRGDTARAAVVQRMATGLGCPP
ncbi:MAG: hypothetical protein U0359_22830 [Byssovorax sp.]